MVDVVADPRRRRGARRRTSGRRRRAATRCRSSGTTAPAIKLGVRRDPRASTASWRRSRAPSRATTATSAKAFAGAAKAVEAAFEFPYLAHARDGADGLRGQARRPTAARSGTASSSRPATRTRWPACSGSSPSRSRSTCSTPAAASAAAPTRTPTYVLEAAQIAKAIGGTARRSSWSGRARTTCAAATTGRSSCTRCSAGLDAARQAGRLAAPHRRPVDRRRHAVRGRDGRRTASTSPRSRARRTCPTRSPTCWSTCTRRRSACRCCGGARSARRTRRSRPRRFIDELAHRGRQGSASSSAARCSRSTRATSACSSSPPRRPAGASRCRRAARPRHRGARVVQHARRAGRRGHACARTARSRSTASSARWTAASRSTRTSSARRWRAASASASRPRCYGAITLEGRRASSSPTSTTTRCCASTRCRRSRCTSCRRPRSPPASASRATPLIAPAVANALFAATGTAPAQSAAAVGLAAGSHDVRKRERVVWGANRGACWLRSQDRVSWQGMQRCSGALNHPFPSGCSRNGQAHCCQASPGSRPGFDLAPRSWPFRPCNALADIV